MISLQEFRKQYPQYEDIDDEQLASKLHAKYYSDIPKEQFYSQIGVTKEAQQKGLKGIGLDIWAGAKEAPGALLQGLLAFPGEAAGAFGQIATNPKRAGQNVLAGFGEYGQNLMNFPSEAANYLADKDLASKAFAQAIPRREERDYRDLVGLEGQEAGDTLLSSAAPMLGIAPAGEIGTLGKLGRTAARSGAFGAQSAIAGENPITGALIAPIAELGVKTAKAIPAAYEALTPSSILAKRFGEKLTPEQLLENERIAEGTSTPLGQVIESPALRGLHENVLPHVPFGKGYQGLDKIGRQVASKADDLLMNLGKSIPEGVDPNVALKDSLIKAHEKQRQIKNDLYKPVNDLEAKEGFSLDLNNFRGTARTMQGALDESILNVDPRVKALYNQAVKISENQSPVSIVEAKMLRDIFKSQAKNFKSSASAVERNKGAQLDGLAKDLTKDIESEISIKGSKELKESLKKADKNYAENYSQWLDELNVLAPETSAQTLIDQIKQGGKSSDKFERLQKIQKLLPKEDQNIIGYGYFQKALDQEGNLNPASLRNVINGLGKRQLEAMFPDKNIRRDVLDYKKLAQMNEGALRTMQNPPTGKTLQSLVPGGAMTAAAFTGASNPIAGAIQLAAPAVGARLASRALESEAMRRKVVEKSIKNFSKKKNNAGPSGKTEEALTLTIPYASKASQEKKQGKK